MGRKRTLHTFKEAAALGPYDEYPVLPAGIDPQLHLSRNDRPQPFFLICEKDTLLVQMSGRGRVEFRDSSVRWWPTVPGDFVYVPARTPHRILPDEVSIHYRYRAEKAGREGAAWYCERCEAQLVVYVWDAATELLQEGYLRAVRQFNAGVSNRTCSACGAVHPEIDLGPYRWEEVARELRSEMEPPQ